MGKNVCLLNQEPHLIITYACQVLRKQSCDVVFFKWMRGYNCEFIKCTKKHGFAGMCFVIIGPYYSTIPLQCGIRGRQNSLKSVPNVFIKRLLLCV